jgi:hypothetical protein
MRTSLRVQFEVFDPNPETAVRAQPVRGWKDRRPHTW